MIQKVEDFLKLNITCMYALLQSCKRYAFKLRKILEHVHTITGQTCN